MAANNQTGAARIYRRGRNGDLVIAMAARTGLIVSRDVVGLLTTALLIFQERRHGARTNPGRKGAVAARGSGPLDNSIPTVSNTDGI